MCVCVCVYIRIYTYIHVYMCVYIYVYIYRYIHIPRVLLSSSTCKHTHAHALTQSRTNIARTKIARTNIVVASTIYLFYKLNHTNLLPGALATDPHAFILIPRGFRDNQCRIYLEFLCLSPPRYQRLF